MKILTVVLLIAFSCNVFAQKTMYVRIYNFEGKKINKGHVVMVTDTSLQLRGDKETVNIPVKSIGLIKTKRSAGNNVLVGSIIGVVTAAIIGVVTADPDAMIVSITAEEGAAIGAILGLPAGAAIGGLTILSKKSKLYRINGNLTNWKEFQSAATEKNILNQKKERQAEK